MAEISNCHHIQNYSKVFERRDGWELQFLVQEVLTKRGTKLLASSGDTIFNYHMKLGCNNLKPKTHAAW